ncbi:UPF0688 protein C1orf174 homolog isoform X2 [Gouania willdenowi]|nr:UPF0688 protein C1orf174 homolog isoform X2 [Gouania willdenowi]XP_028309934.1 UPF0688 protein C1orf174 homolog isoform X2 [Gouania willdenowi]
MKSPKTQPTAGSSTGATGYRKPVDPLETPSLISCECHLSTGSRRCSASPQLENQEGKENKLGAELGRGLEGNRTSDKGEPEHMDYEETGKIVYPDDDSNEILPVEQFFGNLHTVQELPQRPHAASSRAHQRRHYYAPENSDDDDEELNLSSRQHEDGP